MKRILLATLSIIIFASCDNDVYETYAKEGNFTISKISRGGKRHLRGFYVEGHERKIRYNDIRNGKYKVGDNVRLKYDSVVNTTKGTYKIVLQRRLIVD